MTGSASVPVPPAFGRRALLAGAAAALGGLGVACSTSGGGDVSEEDVTGITRLDRLEGDLAVVALLASMENLAIALYETTRELVAEGDLDPLPAPVAAYLDVAQAQHEEHARAWNGILTGSGRQAVTGVNLTLKTTLEPMVGNARDYVGMATAFLEVESVTAATYLAGIQATENNATLKIAASIHPVELQHVTFLHLVLDREPLPGGFATADGARSTTDTIG